MPSISAFLLLLLLVCWKGVRGGLSQLIYHIKYQPSSTFYLSLFPLFTRPPLLSLFLTSRRFHPSFLSPLLLLLLLVCPVPLSLSRFPHTSPSRPSSASLKVPIFLFLNNCHMPPCLTSRLACNDPPSPSLTVFPSPSRNADAHSPPIMSDLLRYNMPDNTKERSHARKISFYQSQQWLLTVQRINIRKDKGGCARIHGEKGIRCRWSFAVCIPRIILQWGGGVGKGHEPLICSLKNSPN